MNSIYYYFFIVLFFLVNGCTTTIITEEVPASAPPDLTASAYSLIKDDSSTWITVKFMNIGETPISPTANGIIDIYIDHLDTPHVTYKFLTMFDRDFLAAGGQSAIYIQNFSELSSGEHLVFVHIDSTNVVEESDETNNRVTKNITVP